jgi:hypothetical protein
MLQTQTGIVKTSPTSPLSLSSLEAITPTSKEIPLRSKIELALGENYSPELLITILKQNPKLKYLYEADSGVLENYTIQEHTLFVLHQFEKYFSNSPHCGISPSTLRLTLALHDIGKTLADKNGNQRDKTLEVLDTLRSELPLSERDWKLCRTLIEHDLIGRLIFSSLSRSASIAERTKIHEFGNAAVYNSSVLYDFAELAQVRPIQELRKDPVFQNKITDAATWFVSKAAAVELTPEELLTLAIIYYQCDTSAYTSDAVRPDGQRAKVGMEYLYNWNWYDNEPRPEKLFVHGQRSLRTTNSFTTGGKSWPLLVFSEGPGFIVSKLQAEVSAMQSRNSAQTKIPDLSDLKELTVAATKKSAHPSTVSSAITKLSQIAEAAYAGKLGAGSLILAKAADSFGPSDLEAESIFGSSEIKSAILRVVALGTNDEQAGDVLNSGVAELQSNFQLGEPHIYTAANEVMLLPSNRWSIEQIFSENFSDNIRAKIPQCALVELGTPTEDEWQTLLAKAFQNMTIQETLNLTKLSTDKIETLTEPGFVFRSKNFVLHEKRLQFIKLPSQEWSILAPEVIGDWTIDQPQTPT